MAYLYYEFVQICQNLKCEFKELDKCEFKELDKCEFKELDKCEF